MASCGATCGITRERDRERSRAREVVEASLRGASVETPWDAAGVGALASAMEEVLPCVAAVVEEERAWWVYLSATVGERAWCSRLAEAGAPVPASDGEQGVRVGLSQLGRYATLQEFSLVGRREPDGVWLEETRCVGVVDRRMQLFVKGAQGLLRSRRVVALDAAFLVEPASDGNPLWFHLFDADEPSVTRGFWTDDRSALGA